MKNLVDKVGSEYNSIYAIIYNGKFIRVNGHIGFTSKEFAHRSLVDAFKRHVTTFYSSRTDFTLRQLLEKGFIVNDRTESNFKILDGEIVLTFLVYDAVVDYLISKYFIIKELK